MSDTNTTPTPAKMDKDLKNILIGAVVAAVLVIGAFIGYQEYQKYQLAKNIERAFRGLSKERLSLKELGTLKWRKTAEYKIQLRRRLCPGPGLNGVGRRLRHKLNGVEWSSS